MEDVPRRGLRGVGALSESEAEEEEVDAALEGGVNPSNDGGVAKAIVKLTKVCSHLAARKPSSKDPIEQILDGGAAGSSDASGLGNNRKNAAALRALKKCLADRPSYIYETIESHLEEDFAARAGRPGMPLGGGTVRGWLESRSRIQNYVGHIRWTWAVGGIWQALIEGRHQEARARAALLVAASDQAAVNNGSWLVSQVAMLEPPAPFHAFVNHQPPSHQELQHSVLLDSRWMELFISHIPGNGQLPRIQEEAWEACSLPQRQQGGEAGAQTKTKTESQEQGRSKGPVRGRDHGVTNDAFRSQVAGSSLGSTSGAAPCQFDRWCANPGEGISGEPASYSDVALDGDSFEKKKKNSACMAAGGFQAPHAVGSNDDSIRVPGARASSFSGRVFFNKLTRFLMNSRSGLGSFARSSVGLSRASSFVRSTTDEAELLRGRGFPIPLPYPEALRKKWFSTPEVVARKKFLNAAICVLNFLHLGRPAVCPPNLNVGNQLSSMQWVLFDGLSFSWTIGFICLALALVRWGERPQKLRA